MIEMSDNQFPMGGCVQPEEQSGCVGRYQCASVESYHEGVRESCAEQRSRERNEHNTQEQEQIEPEEISIYLPDEMQHVMVCNPVHTNNDETQHKCCNVGLQWAQIVKREIRHGWGMEVENQQCNDDGENAVAEGFESGLIHFTLPVARINPFQFAS